RGLGDVYPPSLPPQAPAQPVPPATGAAPPSPSAGPDRRTDGSLPPQD
ncbi:MAG TPA: twin-arginine translocase subunit TatB, partial [Rhodospirillum rubrum]|nr:twin-arginine translocase subunit TatB [Rhodospirillum rubrum]